MPFERASGVLLHPTSLPSQFGIGDLGRSAYEFVDFLADSGQKLWQVLPLGPTGYGNSPYMSYSAIAGNPMLISPEILKEQGLLSETDFTGQFSTDVVDFDAVIPYKTALLESAYHKFKDYRHHHHHHHHHHEFEKFCEAEAQWLDDYALFMALLEIHHGASWHTWASELAKREPEALKQKTEELSDRIQFHKFLQFKFFEQWQKLRKHANQKKIQIIGDIPIYVAHNSADVWANRETFALDPDTFEVALMAGVPPDYFSATGQLWGNPVYNWEYLEKTKFAWWIERFRFMLRFVDIIRIDHFRGFEAYWQVPAGEKTAINGTWEKAPGVELFETLKETLGTLPILAEDLGLITPEVEELRDRFEFPGMRVLLFAFGGDAGNVHLPHNYVSNSLVYTGTHDNDTVVGWWIKASKHEKAFLTKYLAYPGTKISTDDIHWILIRLALASVSNLAIIPLQDILGMDNSARMNRPGTSTGNWAWRYASSEALSQELSQRLLEITKFYGR